MGIRAFSVVVFAVFALAGLTACPGYLENLNSLVDGDGGLPFGFTGNAGDSGTAGGPANTPAGTGGAAANIVSPNFPADAAAPSSANQTPVASAPAAPCYSAAEITKNILMPKCAGCHKAAADAPAAMLDLLTAGSRGRILAAKSKSANATCKDKPMATISGQTVSGLFIDKVNGQQGMCGVRMPIGLPALTDQEIQCVKDWFVKNQAPAAQAAPDAGVAAAAPTGGGATYPNESCTTPADAVTKIFASTSQCAQCHSPATGNAGGIDLSGTGAEIRARLVNVKSKACSRQPVFVELGAAGATGFLFDKLSGSTNGCGARMPFIAPYLNDQQVQCIKDWLLSK